MMSLPRGPGSQYRAPTQCCLSPCGKSELSTEFRATSHRSAADIFHTCAATEYSSTNGSLVMWICNGSSVDSATRKPRAKNTGKGFRW